MDKTKLKAILECLLFMATEPLGLNELKKLLESQKEKEEVLEETLPEEVAVASAEAAPVEETSEPAPIAELAPENILDQLLARNTELAGEISKGEIKDALDEIIQEYQGNPAKGFELVSVAKGYQFRTKMEWASYVRAFYKAPKTRISAPGMETLAIVAYQQPLSRAKIEEVRGVDTGGVLKTLIDRDLVRVVGRSEEPGRPLLYGTTRAFLETFNLQSISDLPTLRDLEALESEQRLASGGSAAPEEAAGESMEVETVFESADAGWDEESQNLIEDLENSMKSLRSLEKTVFEPEVTPAEESDVGEGLKPAPTE